MTAPGVTNVAVIDIPSTSPFFITIVVLHILVGLVCVATGAIAMLSKKRPGRHPNVGTAYFWSLSAVFLSATMLSAVRWGEDYHLFILGALSLGSATLGRMARRQRWRGWIRLHLTGMGVSYILLLTAFYVDNGHSLPVWKDLPSFTYWVAPCVVGIPLIVLALLRHPLARYSRPRLPRT